MKYIDKPNLLLESITYLCRRSSGNTWDKIDEKIKKRNFQCTPQFNKTFSKLKKFTNSINKNITLNEDIGNKFFTNIEGFPFNTIGSSSVAFLLFYNVFEEFDENFDLLIKSMKDLPYHKVAYNIAEALDISDNFKCEESINEGEFIDMILSLSVPSESKIIILDTYRNYKNILDEIYLPIKNVIDFLSKNEDKLIEIITTFSLDISNIGYREFFKKISKLNILDEIKYTLRPFIFGMDTTLTSNETMNTVQIYCGILRKELLDMLNKENSYVDDVYEAYNLLGDRTRFDILCYLRKNKAYGLELSNQFNLSRNTIHHHMSKLINSGLITCTTDGKRVYYSLDTEAFEKLISNQRELFLIKK